MGFDLEASAPLFPLYALSVVPVRLSPGDGWGGSPTSDHFGSRPRGCPAEVPLYFNLNLFASPWELTLQ